HSEEDMSEKDLSNAILEVANALHKTLSGFKVFYNLDTHPADEDEDYFPLEDLDAELAETREELEKIEGEKE
ncbi:MAG: hypothetical protein ACFE7R_03445, partial [Candidatus Hodarchaeota archaeon]